MIFIIKHVEIEGPGIIAEFFQNTNWGVKIIDLNKDKLPKDFSEVEAIVVLGGPMNVYEKDRYPFLKDEDEFLKKAIKEEIPILGICLGAQLLAKACGAKVKKAKQEEIGWYKVILTKEGRKDCLFEDADEELDVFQWHQDFFEIPEKAVLLATSNSCKNQAFRFGKNAYGLQFHIEVTPNMIESWISEYVDSDDQAKLNNAQRILIDTYKKEEQVKKQANKILLNFSRFIDERSLIGQ